MTDLICSKPFKQITLSMLSGLARACSEKVPPAGNAADRLRRSVGAARAVLAVEASEPYGQSSSPGFLDDDDSSLVLYKDPSGVSAQQSKGSVLSGAHAQGDTFFTALKRQYSWQSDTDLDLQTLVTARHAGSSLSCVNSQANPIQSVANSAFFSVADDGSECGAGGSSLQVADEATRAADFAASMESSYATAVMAAEASGSEAGAADGQTPRAANDQLLTSSVLDIINSLYCAHDMQDPADSNSSPWQHLAQEDQPLIARPATAALAAARAAAGTDQQNAAEMAVWTGKEQELADSISCRLGTSFVQLENSSDKEPPSDPGQDVGVDIAQAAEEADPGHQQQQVDKASDIEHTASLISAAAARQQQQAHQEEDIEQDNHDMLGSSSSTVLLAHVDTLLAERSRMQAELSGYLEQLSNKADDEGQQLVDLSADYAVLVERLLQQGREQQYRALQDWEGPHRFEDLPVAQLPTHHSDARVAAGLQAIAKLDEALKEAGFKALVAARTANPQQWADAEKRRLERRAAELDAALARERQRRLHAAKLRRAINKLDEQQAGGSDSMLNVPGAGSYFRYYQLTPKEEELLAAVMARNEAALEAFDPFDPTVPCLEDCDAADSGNCTPADGTTPSDRAAESVSSKHMDKQQQAVRDPGMTGLKDSSTDNSSSCLLEGAAGDDSAHNSDQESAEAACISAGGSHGEQQAPGTASTTAGSDAVGSDAGLGNSSSLSGVSSFTGTNIFALLRPSSAGGSSSRRHRSLAEIDAGLEALQAERSCRRLTEGTTGHAGGGSTGPIRSAGTRRSSSSSSSNKPATRNLSAQHSVRTAASSGQSDRLCSPCAAQAGPAPTRQQSVSSSSRTPRRTSSASGASSGRSSSTVRTIDYIREMREARELVQREREVDAKLRELQTSELQTKLMPEQLQLLLQTAY